MSAQRKRRASDSLTGTHDPSGQASVKQRRSMKALEEEMGSVNAGLLRYELELVASEDRLAR